ALGELPPPLAEALRPSLEQLRAFSSSELLAAGKLAGDPQALLLQAERAMAVAPEQLAHYADSSSAAAAPRDRQPLFDAHARLLRLAHARNRFLSQQRQELFGDVERELRALAQQVQALEALPLLGVSESAGSTSTGFAALLGLESGASQVQAEDRGIGLKR